MIDLTTSERQSAAMTMIQEAVVFARVQEPYFERNYHRLTLFVQTLRRYDPNAVVVPQRGHEFANFVYDDWDRPIVKIWADGFNFTASI